MQLSVSNATANSLVTSVLNSNSGVIDSDITIGSAQVNTSQITAGNSFINSTAISVPQINISGNIWNGIGYLPLVGPGYGAIVNVQIFTANGTWNNPYNDVANPIQTSLSGNEQVFVMLWGAGGQLTTRAGGGGACNLGNFKISDLGANVSVTVGNATGGTNGEPSIFSTLIAHGGGRGAGGTGNTGGGGGGVFSQGQTGGNGQGGDPNGGTGASAKTSSYGGGKGDTGNPGNTVFGGSGGGQNITAGAYTIYGGAGGATTSAAGVSVFGGQGGNNTVGPTAPGGGGGGAAPSNGAIGEVRVWVIK